MSLSLFVLLLGPILYRHWYVWYCPRGLLNDPYFLNSPHPLFRLGIFYYCVFHVCLIALLHHQIYWFPMLYFSFQLLYSSVLIGSFYGFCLFVDILTEFIHFSPKFIDYFYNHCLTSLFVRLLVSILFNFFSRVLMFHFEHIPMPIHFGCPSVFVSLC